MRSICDRLIALALAFTLLTLSVLAAEPKETEVTYIRPFPILMYQESEATDLKPLAEDIGKLLGSPVIQSAKGNPVCCVWLEITNYTPNPGEPGYIIINQGGGSIIQASDVEQMKLAVERFKSTAKKTADGVLVPQGLLTNYKIVK